MFGFDRLQPLEQLVVLGVGQLGRIQHVVQMRMMAQLFSQRCGFIRGVAFGLFCGLIALRHRMSPGVVRKSPWA